MVTLAMAPMALTWENPDPVTLGILSVVVGLLAFLVAVCRLANHDQAAPHVQGETP